MKNTKAFVRILCFSFTVLGLLAAYQQPISGISPAQASDRPNIVLIMADDMGYSDIGCFGSEIATPNIDRLAAEGIKLTNFYNASRCCPTRAALMTGVYPVQADIGEMDGDDGVPGYRGFLSRNTVTMAEVLGENGYHCMISGKWHLGQQEHAWPMKRGFHRQYASTTTTGHYFGIAKDRPYVIDDQSVEVPGEWIEAGQTDYKLFKNADGSQWYATDAYTDRAMENIEDLRKADAMKPFFLYLPYTAPHWPLHAFEEDIAKYEGKYLAGWDAVRQQRYRRLVELGIVPETWKLSPRNQQAKDWNHLTESEKKYYDRMMATYAAMIDRMDQNIGRLLTFLEEKGELENTIIFFLSDNGGSAENVHKGKEGVPTGRPDSFDSYEASWANVSNTPFQWFKQWTHEGGNATPLIAWYPKMIKAGTMDKQVAHVIDLMPTVCELAGAKYPATFRGNQILPLEGKSLVPVLEGKQREGHRVLFWNHLGHRAARKGDWKIVSRYEAKTETELPWELYDMSKDRTETNNLAKKYPQVVAELETEFANWFERTGSISHKNLVAMRKGKR
ncbi:arylsulfatase [Persicitalea jodogahamensis]|uniref:Arylsulfatase n=1 Tax=Persicitalea jodogahamensis TaxID=402147 RepID=A0A8J3D5T8_9BACT|nr:arylsulfatase [Persicitalea jodogahamensis]GHB54252.1 arylsulfatase [Persicitalea jodogahamensis]